jgi:hypothetical protein
LVPAGCDFYHVGAQPVSRTIVPFRPAVAPPVLRRVSRVTGGRRLGSLGAGTSVASGPPVGAGAGAGAEIGASQGASIGSTIVPGIGTAIGAVIGAIGGAIAGAINKKDPENVDFDAAVALWQQNPNAVYSIGNPYLALAGLFDLNITTNIPIYRKFGHMGEEAFVVWLCNLVYQAAQAGRIGANDTALTVMSNIVQPAINAWGYGAMSDPHADLINRLIVTMILQYTEGAQGNWYAIGGDYPDAFNSIPPFALPAAKTTTTQQAAPVTNQTCQAAQAAANMPQRPANGSFTNGATITPSSGTYIGDGAGEWFFGPDVMSGATGYGNAFYQATNPSGGVQTDWVGAAGVQATVVNGQVYLQNSAGQWWSYNGVNWFQVPTVPALSTPATTQNAAVAATATPQPPAAPTKLLTADGSQVTAPGTAVETAQGTLIYLGPQAAGDPDNQYGYPVWEQAAGSAPVHSGYLAGLLVLNGGNIYGVTTPGGWFQWTSNNWVVLSGPPTATTAPTTSQVASPQATQACTPATTGGGGSVATPPVTNQTQGAVVGTTTSGDAITDSDIQSLVDQMSSQNATAQQTYDAVIQELESSGASVTTGLQNQVAAQVQASLPAAAASSSSDMGLYIVGGGLALAGLLYFMNRRRA